MTICKKMAVLDKMTIDDIFFLLDQDHLSQAKSLLLKANHIQIFSQNSNLLIAQDFALKMNRIQKTLRYLRFVARKTTMPIILVRMLVRF